MCKESSSYLISKMVIAYHTKKGASLSPFIYNAGKLWSLAGVV
jgi:hypothetical protein